MGSDLLFMQERLNDERLPILERIARELRKRELSRSKPFKALFKQLDELEIDDVRTARRPSARARSRR